MYPLHVLFLGVDVLKLMIDVMLSSHLQISAICPSSPTFILFLL